MKIGDITANYIHELLTIGTTLGLAPSALLSQIGLSPKALQQGDERIDLVYLMRLGYTIIQQTGRYDLGLLGAANTHVSRFGYAGLAALTAVNLGDALQTLVDFEGLYCSCYRGSSKLHVDPAGAQLQFYSISPYNDYNRFVVDSILFTWLRSLRDLTAQDDLVRSIHIEFAAPHYQVSYTHATRAKVHFSQPANFLLLRENALSTPLPSANPWLHQELLQECKKKLAQIAHANTWNHRVQRVLGTMLHGKAPTIDAVAEQLGIPSWTLRRKLSDENASFQGIVDSTRKDVALSYLRNTELSFGEVSYLLGFSTPGAFQRAFKRWMDTTPGDYRRLQARRNKGALPE
ncbi:Transcriptional regulator, AraC family [gamma proteobacterium HdN1]|nr:Transcriptional regulator, AraC family [gamma proteobacterium HdN1]